MLTLEIANISNAKHRLKLKFKCPLKDHSSKNMGTSDGRPLLIIILEPRHDVGDVVQGIWLPEWERALLQNCTK